MVSNGDVLNGKRLNMLYESGLDYLQISVYDGPEDEEKFKELFRQNNIDSSKFKIRPRYLPPEENFGLNLSNRGGTMENAEFSIPSLEEARERPCYYLHYLFLWIIMWTLFYVRTTGEKIYGWQHNESNFRPMEQSKMKVARQKSPTQIENFLHVQSVTNEYSWVKIFQTSGKNL